MADLKHCGGKEEHGLHMYTKEVEVYCVGKSPCGAWAHTQHWFTETQEFWCEGVCDCGMLSRGPHGPGTHK